MAVTTEKFTIQSLERAMGFSLNTGELDFIVDDIQDGTLSCAQETVFQTGKNGMKIGASDRNKESTMAINNGALVDGALANQIGAQIDTATIIVPGWLDIVTLADNGGTIEGVTEKTAVGTAGNEIGFVYTRNADGTRGQKFTQAASASTTEFAYNPATKKITPPTGMAAGDKLIAVYDVEATGAKRIRNSADTYSQEVKLVVDVFVKDICGKSYMATIIFYRAKADGNFELTLSGEGFVHNMSFQAMYNGCIEDGQKILWDFILYNEEDVA